MAGYDQAGPYSTPGLYLEQDFNLMQRDFKNREAQLAGQQLTPEEYNNLIRGLQNEYNDQEIIIRRKQEVIKRTNDMVDIGHLSEQEGMKSNWITVLPRETAAAMEATREPPKEEKFTAPFSPSQLEGYGESAAEFGEATAVTKAGKSAKKFKEAHYPDESGRLGVSGKVRTQQSLLRQYKAWRTNIGYDSMDSNKQRQVDSEWDSWIGTQGGKWNWDPKRSKQIQALRAKGPLSRGYGAQFRGTPTGPTEGRNPLHDAVSRALPRKRYDDVPIQVGEEVAVAESKVITRDIAIAIMQEAGGDRAKARRIAAERGYSL